MTGTISSWLHGLIAWGPFQISHLWSPPSPLLVAGQGYKYGRRAHSTINGPTPQGYIQCANLLAEEIREKMPLMLWPVEVGVEVGAETIPSKKDMIMTGCQRFL